MFIQLAAGLGKHSNSSMNQGTFEEFDQITFSSFTVAMFIPNL